MLAWVMNLGFGATEAAVTASIVPFRRLGLGLSCFLICVLVPL